VDQPGRRHAVTTDDAPVNSPQTVRAVVFDVGNVLYQWSLRALFAPRIADVDQLNWFLCNVVTQEWHFQHDAGCSIAEMVAERKAEFPDYADLIDIYASHFNESIFAPVPGALEIVTELAAHGVPIFGITNFGAEFWAGFRPTAPVFDHFTDIIVSGEEKIMKPDPAIYRLALTRFCLAAGDGIFVDDRRENVDAAKANGFVGHYFTDAATLRTDLQKRKLL
jgi:2-haloacid dehalogenase